MTRPRYSITKATVTPESAEQGDYAEQWVDTPYADLEPDTYDREDAADAGLDPVVYLALDVLRKNYATNPSNHPPGDRPAWYSTPDPEEDYRTGERAYTSVHFKGLTPRQWQQLHVNARAL